MFKGCLRFIYRFINSVYPFFHPFHILAGPIIISMEPAKIITKLDQSF